jgi:hypothetical protein
VNGRKEAKREAEVPSLECQEIPSWQMSLSNIVQFPEMSDNLSNTAIGTKQYPITITNSFGTDSSEFTPNGNCKTDGY